EAQLDGPGGGRKGGVGQGAHLGVLAVLGGRGGQGGGEAQRHVGPADGERHGGGRGDRDRLGQPASREAALSRLAVGGEVVVGGGRALDRCLPGAARRTAR